MAERRHKQETQKAPKTYNIKMPVYTTSMMEQEEGLFGGNLPRYDFSTEGKIEIFLFSNFNG